MLYVFVQRWGSDLKRQGDMNAVYKDTYSRSSGTGGSIVAIRSRGSLQNKSRDNDEYKMDHMDVNILCITILCVLSLTLSPVGPVAPFSPGLPGSP